MATPSPGPHRDKRFRRESTARPSACRKYLFGLLAFVFNARLVVAATCEPPTASIVNEGDLGGCRPCLGDELLRSDDQRPGSQGAEAGPRVPPRRACGSTGLVGSTSGTTVMTWVRSSFKGAQACLNLLEWPHRLRACRWKAALAPTSKKRHEGTVDHPFTENELEGPDRDSHGGVCMSAGSALRASTIASFASSSVAHGWDALGLAHTLGQECADSDADPIIDALREGAAGFAVLFSILATSYAVCAMSTILPNVWQRLKDLPIAIRFPASSHRRCGGRTLIRAWTTGSHQPRRAYARWNREVRRRRARARWIRDAEPGPYAERISRRVSHAAAAIRHLVGGDGPCVCRPAVLTDGQDHRRAVCPGERNPERRRTQSAGLRRGNPRGQRLWVRALISMALWWTSAAAPAQTTDFHDCDEAANARDSRPTMARGGYNLLWDQRDIQRAKAKFQVAHCDVRDAHDGPRAGDEGDAGTMLSVITANVHSLNHRVEEVMAWDADVVLLQETKLTAHAIKDVQGVVKRDGWTMVHGKPARLVSEERAKGGPGPAR